MIRSPLMTVMTDAVMKASRSLKRDFGEVENLQVSRKGPGDFVSAADRKAETDPARRAGEGPPRLRLRHGGETASSKGTDPSHRWHIDPLDGTTNFLHGLPQFAISVGLERDGQVVAGVDLRSGQGRAVHRREGQGRLSQQPPHPRRRPRADMADAVVACGLPHIGKGDHGAVLREAAAVMAQVGGMRRLGAAALDLAYVACGRFDAYWERGLNSWDVAAGILLIREAGGFVSDADGGSDPLTAGCIACGNETMHRELLKLLKKAKALIAPTIFLFVAALQRAMRRA